MDKETLSNYGWIVICVMVLAVMLAFASPFGNFVANAIKSTTQGLFDTNQNALDSAGIEIMEQEFEEMLNGPSATDSPVKFGQPYQSTMDGMLMEYVFYADGSAIMWMADAMAEYMPAGSFTYTATEVIMGEDPLSITPDGTTLYHPNDETVKMTVKSVSKGSPKTNTAYVADPNGLVGVTGVDIQIGTDGSITIYQNGVAGETIPASSIQWYENYYTIDGEIAGAIYPDGSKVSLEGIVCVIGCTHENTELRNVKDPTCTEDGSDGDVFCTSCNMKVSTGETIPALGHDIVIDKAIDATCLFSGKTAGEHCTRCNYKIAQTTIAALGHSYPEDDCICTNCGQINATPYSFTVSDYLDKTGIDLSSGNIIIPKTFQDADGKWYFVRSIANKAFYNCTGLESVDLPDTVQQIWNESFRGCTNLKHIDIKEGLESIGTFTFFDCNSLTSINIPSTTTSIHQLAFWACPSLKEIVVDANNTAYCSVDGVLFSKDMTVIQTYPSAKAGSTYTIPNTVLETTSGTFYKCNNLTNINISTNMQKFGTQAFYQCINLKSIIMPDTVITLGSSMFSGCASLEEVRLSNNITEIPDSGVFYGCTSLKSIIIPDNVVTIGTYAFNGCTGLTNVTIGKNVQKINSEAFRNCTSLKNLTIPASVNYIAARAFADCNITNVTFEKTDGWYVSTSNTATSGTNIDVSTPANGAQRIKTFKYYYWFNN